MQLASSLGWGPLVSLSRSSVCSLFVRLQVGLLTIHDADGTTLHFGEESLKAAADNQDEGTSSSSSSSSSVGSVYLDSEKPIRATLDVKRDEFWVRMFFGADLGFSEAYMAGEVETPDLGDCFDVSGRSDRGPKSQVRFLEKLLTIVSTDLLCSSSFTIVKLCQNSISA